jgi:hypothetical protein
MRLTAELSGFLNSTWFVWLASGEAGGGTGGLLSGFRMSDFANDFFLTGNCGLAFFRGFVSLFVEDTTELMLSA